MLQFNSDALSVYKNEFSPQMQTIGYSSYNSIIILNTIALMMILYILQVLLYYILKLIYIFKYNENQQGPGKKIY